MKRKYKRKGNFWSKWYNWLFLIVAGFSIIVWADSLCDFLKNQADAGTWRVFWWTSGILIFLAIVGSFKKIIILFKGQLGG